MHAPPRDATLGMARSKVKMELGRNFVPASQQTLHGLLKNFQLLKSWIRICGAQPLMGDKHRSTYGSFKGIKETFLLRVASQSQSKT